MTNIIVDDLEAAYAAAKNFVKHIEGTQTVQTIETEAVAIGVSAFDYIKANGLTALYKIAQGVLLGVATGQPYTATLATVVSQGEAAGIQIAKGAEAIVVAQAQADLIAAGKLIAPSTQAVVAAPVPAPAA